MRSWTIDTGLGPTATAVPDTSARLRERSTMGLVIVAVGALKS